MAYQKRYKKRYKKKPSIYAGLTLSNAMKTAALARSAYYGVRYIKGLVNSEMLHNNGTATISPDNTGTIIPLTSIAQGDSSSGRTGNSILLKNIFLRIAANNNTAQANTFYRIIVFQDLQQVGDTNPAVSDVLESVNYLSPLATAQEDRDWETIIR